MTWSDLQPAVRAAILAVGALLVILLVWMFVVSPLSARAADLTTQADAAENRLEQLERQVEAVPPASQAELTAWQNSENAMLGQLGPESELPLFIEMLIRASESEGVDAFIGATSASDVAALEGLASQTEQVLGTIPGARRVALTVTAFGDYAAIGRFVSQVGRQGWVTELGGVQMFRSFPEVAAEISVIVYFRAGQAGTASAVPVNGAGQQGAR